MAKQFPALPGFYYYFFLYLEPLSTFGPAFTCLFYPGTAWFYHELVPSAVPPPTTIVGMEDRTVAAVWQLANAYMLLGLLQSIGWRAVRDTLSDKPAVQERIIGASMAALAFADVTHVIVSLIAAPADIRFDFANWNAMSHGNITAVIVLCLVRLAWFAGIGRTRYYFGQEQPKDGKKKKKS
ncbi:hypothetical protein D9615_006415 [Tricholomella constricta]|uniref:DUF7704 domain-containing protein n=1 Tax=Tricholomella constricta TaxID=117010 RepID=A0A8H5H687_9AGAR|nr:hypothetical protein D9615_006415 [Tricholomella constricta]